MIKNKEDVLAVFKIFDGIDIEDKFKYESKKYISDLVEYSHSFENSKKTPLCKIYCLGDIYIGQIRYFKWYNIEKRKVKILKYEIWR